MFSDAIRHCADLDAVAHLLFFFVALFAIVCANLGDMPFLTSFASSTGRCTGFVFVVAFAFAIMPSANC